MLLKTTLIILGLSIVGFLFLALSWAIARRHRYNKLRAYFNDKLSLPGPRSQFAKIDGVKIHYVVEGKGSDILLLHGIGANLYCWRHMIPLLAKKHRVWALDLAGFGHSDKPRNRSYGLEAQAALVAKFIELNHMKNVVLVGNSMGAAISAELATSRPDLIKSLVLINSVYSPDIVGLLDLRKVTPFASLISPFINRPFIKTLLKKLYGTDMKITEEMVDAYLAPYVLSDDASHTFVAAFEALVENEHLTDELKKSKLPILILWGEKDKLTKLRYGKELAEQLKHARFVSHPEGGHHIQEELPEWVSEKISDFISH